MSVPTAQATQVETNTWTGSGIGRFNEDYALLSAEQACGVLVDGATGLTKVNLVAGESDAAWYARTLCKETMSRLGEPGAGMSGALLSAGAAAAEAYRAIPGATELEHIDEPNGSVCLLRWQGSKVEVGLLGDCTAVVGLVDGSCLTLHDDTLSKLDDQNYERMYAYAIERNTTMAAARKALNPRFIENRLKMNEPGGYWAADLTCKGFEHTDVHSFAAQEVAWLFACTDGYENAVAMGVVRSPEELALRVAAGEGKLLGEELRKAEQLDADCWRVHRSKTSDDATYVFVRLSPCATC